MKRIPKKAYIKAAQRLYYVEGECEIDDETTISKSNPPDGGAYVKAWVWVSEAEAETETGK